jgi:citrate synthase
MSDKPYSPGLEGIVAGMTTISEVDPHRQKLAYRGYDIEDLANHATFEEVAYLLLMGELPNASQLEEFKSEVAANRALPDELVSVLRLASKPAHPMDVLRTAVSFLGESDPEVNDNSHDANLRKAKRLLGQISSIVAAAHHLKHGCEPVAPRADLGFAANLLYMILGKPQDEFNVKVLDVSLILYAEHSFNASTFTARVIASTLSDMHSAIVGAIGALKGALHGGANERAMETLLRIGDPAKAEQWVMDALARKERLMGFGHRVYRWGDSRVPTMTRLAQELSERVGNTKWHGMATTMRAVMEREKNMHPNVDFPCGYTYYLLGLPIELYTPIFSASRIAGWAAHVIEQHDNNRLIRPDCIYEGHRGREWTPIEERQ